MTTLALVAIASGVVAVLLVIVRLLGARTAAANVDLSRITVSRQWLIQHQSNDRV